MKINFKELRVQLTFEGQPAIVDMRKALGNAIRQNTADIGLDEVARKIYFSDKEVEIPEEYINDIIAITSKSFVVPVQEAIKNILIEKNDITSK